MKANLIGNWSLLNVTGNYDAINGISGNRVISSSHFLVEMFFYDNFLKKLISRGTWQWIDNKYLNNIFV